MTTRHMGYLVVLDEDIREDDAQEIISAIKMIKFVAVVQPVKSNLHADIIATQRRDGQWLAAIGRLTGEMDNTPSAGHRQAR